MIDVNQLTSLISAFRVGSGETCINETQYMGKDRPIRVLRLELS